MFQTAKNLVGAAEYDSATVLVPGWGWVLLGGNDNNLEKSQYLSHVNGNWTTGPANLPISHWCGVQVLYQNNFVIKQRWFA